MPADPADPDSLIDALEHARDQRSVPDPIVERLRGNVRRALLGKASEPPRIARFEILERIGEGGMGVVYAAHDPKLDRRIALKVLYGRRDAESRDRLLREARALAKLSHPNVISVFDADVVGGDVFLAMELVRGRTAREWTPASWRDAVRVYRDAGCGLAAAHRAGIVHGDFKPANVIVGDDGRVRVLDFGLASQVEAAPPATVSMGSGSRGGTLAYMAPEQLVGGPHDPRGDQFSFCVALYEAIYGKRPFSGSTPAALHAAIGAGPLRLPASPRVPRRLRAALRRGLHARADARFPSMMELLDALAPPRRSRSVVVAAACSVVVAGTAIVVVRGHDASGSCALGSSNIADVWNGGHGVRTQLAFVATGRYHATDSARLVRAQLDAYAAAIDDAERSTCERERASPFELAQLHDLRAGCLARRREALAALVEVFEHADADVVDHAVQATYALPPVAECGRSEVLLARPAAPEDPQMHRRIDAASASLARASALHEAGRYPAAAAATEKVLAEARATGYAPLEAEALYLTGVLQFKRATPAIAEATFHECTVAAERARDDALAARAWTQLTVMAGRLTHFDEAIRDAEQARAKLERVADRKEIDASLDLTLGQLYLYRGTLDAAERSIVQGLHAYEAIDPDRPRVVSALTMLATLYNTRSRYDAAIASAERAVALSERLLGPSHPVTAAALNALANGLAMRGRYPAAIAAGERALAIFKQTHGPDADAVATAEQNLSGDYIAIRDLDKAEAALRDAMRIREKIYGADNPQLARSYDALGEVLLLRPSAPRGARPWFERALALEIKAYGDQDVRTNQVRYHLGVVDQALGDYDAAIREHTRARAAFAAALGEDSLKVAMAEFAIGQTLAQKRDLRGALPHLELAVSLGEREKGNPLDLAVDRWFLARTLADLGRDLARTQQLAQAARAIYAGAGPAYASSVHEIDAWLASHPPGARSR